MEHLGIQVGPGTSVQLTPALGVHSEVGTLRTVLVCRPGLAHQRLTPSKGAELLFDACSGCTRRRRTTMSC
jgi:hypothetical protein